MSDLPQSICGSRKTNQVIFVCWRDKAHDGPHLSFMQNISLHQVHGLLIDSAGEIVQPQPDDIPLVEATMGRFLEYVSD